MPQQEDRQKVKDPTGSSPQGAPEAVWTATHHRLSLKNVDQNCQPLPYKAAKQSLVYNTTLSPTSVCHISIQKSQHNHPCKKFQQNVVSLAQRTPNHTSPRRERCIALIQATASLLQHRAETLSFPIHGS